MHECWNINIEKSTDIRSGGFSQGKRPVDASGYLP